MQSHNVRRLGLIRLSILTNVCYDAAMIAKLTDEQREAIQQCAGQPVQVEDGQTNEVYVLVDRHTHERAMQALRREEADVAAIQAGLDAAAAGNVSTLEEADRRIRETVGFPPRR